MHWMQSTKLIYRQCASPKLVCGFDLIHGLEATHILQLLDQINLLPAVDLHLAVIDDRDETHLRSAPRWETDLPSQSSISTLDPETM